MKPVVSKGLLYRYRLVKNKNENISKYRIFLSKRFPDGIHVNSY